MIDFIEILLWNSVVIISFSLSFFFWGQYKTKPVESKQFYLALGVFSMGYGTARLLENIRRYNIGTYHDIFEHWVAGGQIAELNLILRILYYIISWFAISAMFYNFEKTIFPRNHYIITITSILEAACSIINYFYFNLITFYLCSFLFFIILTVAFMFINLAWKSPPGSIRNGSIFLAIGITLFALGVMIDLPEFRYFIYSNNNEALYIETLVRLTSPIILIIGFFIIFRGFGLLMIQPEKELKLDSSTKILMGKMGIDFTRPDDLSKEDIAFSREQFICLVCKASISMYYHIFLCSDCKALYCEACAQALSGLENTCWSCDSPIDVLKPIKKIVEAKSQQKESHHKIEKKIRKI